MIGVVEDETLQLHIYHVHSLLQIDVIDDNPTDWTPSECAGTISVDSGLECPDLTTLEQVSVWCPTRLP